MFPINRKESELTMSNEIMVTTAANAITNKVLAKHVQEIAGTMLSTEQNGRRVAYILASISEDKSYADDFSTCAHFAQEVLGLGKSQAAAVIKVGNWFIKDGATYSTILKHDVKDYTVTQLQALLPLKKVDIAIQWAEDGIINPFMSIKEIKELVKAYRDAEKKALGEGEGEGEGKDDNSDKSETVEKAEVTEVTVTIQARIECGMTEDGRYVINNAIVDKDRYQYVMDFINSLGM